MHKNNQTADIGTNGGIFESLPALLLSTFDLQTFLNGVATMAAAVVEQPATCGITMPLAEGHWTIASSDPRARQVDEAQHSSGSGPCLEAITTGEPVEIRDQATDQRWPQYARRALELGVRRSLTVPIVLGDRLLGALTVHGYDEPRPFAADDLDRLQVFADQAATAIALAFQRSEQQDLTDHLEKALKSRVVIDQAIGVLMAHERCTADAAFDMLRRHSQSSNRKLRDVAADLIHRMTGHPPGDPVPFGSVPPVDHGDSA